MILERNKKIMLAEDDQQAMSKVYEEITEVLSTFYTEKDVAKKEGKVPALKTRAECRFRGKNRGRRRDSSRARTTGY